MRKGRKKERRKQARKQTSKQAKKQASFRVSSDTPGGYIYFQLKRNQDTVKIIIMF